MRAIPALLLMALLAPAALAQPALAAPATWSHTIALSSALDETLHVTTRARGLAEEAILPIPPASMLRNLTIAQGDLRKDGDRYFATGTNGDLEIAYESVLARPSGTFALARTRDVTLTPAEATPRILLSAPAGWASAGPAVGHGIAIYGRDIKIDRENVSGRTFVYAAETPQAQDLDHLATAMPYLAARHAPLPGLLVIRAPDGSIEAPILEGGGIAVPASASIETLAQALARHHQRYRVVEVAPTSAAWFREGEERLHVETTLLASGARSANEVDLTFLRARGVANADGRLLHAPAGSELAREKGLVVVRALDPAIRNATQGARSLADLLLALDARPANASRLDSRDVQEAAEAIANASFAEFFDRYVYGTEWPTHEPLGNVADVFVTNLTVEPARAQEGQQVGVAHTLVNRGTRAASLDIPLRIDGALAGAIPVRLAVGESARGVVPIEARGLGDHSVEAGGLRATLRVLAPAALSLERAASAPDSPRAGEAFQLLVYVHNSGELPGRARLEVREHGRLLQRTTEASVEGRSADAMTLPLRIEDAGLHVLEITLFTEAGTQTIDHDVTVAGSSPRDAPAPGVFALVAALGAAFALRRAQKK